MANVQHSCSSPIGPVTYRPCLWHAEWSWMQAGSNAQDLIELMPVMAEEEQRKGSSKNMLRAWLGSSQGWSLPVGLAKPSPQVATPPPPLPRPKLAPSHKDAGSTMHGCFCNRSFCADADSLLMYATPSQEAMQLCILMQCTARVCCSVKS